MAAVSPIIPTIAERPEEETAASTVEGIDKKLDCLNLKSGEAPKKKKKKKQPALPANHLSIHPTPYFTAQSPIFHPHAFAALPPNNERSYVLEIRQRQHERTQRFSDALHSIEVRIKSTQSKAEGAKLRKEAKLLKKQVADSLTQEQMITLRLNDIENEELARNPYWQAQSAGLVPYHMPWSPFSPVTPWSAMTLPMMSPMHGPVSPLTPLPPGLYHPSPIMPSPLNSPFWMGAPYQYQTMDYTTDPYMQNGQAYYPDAEFEQPNVVPQEFFASQPLRRQSITASVAKLREGTGHKGAKSVEFKLPQESANRSRRWSLASTFLPTPKDKRMSVPGLETIWKSAQEETAQKETAPEETAQKETAQEETAQEETAQKETVQEESIQQDTAQEETDQEKTGQEKRE